MQSKNVWQLSKKRKHLTRNDMSCGCSAMFFIFSRFSQFLSTKNSKEKNKNAVENMQGKLNEAKCVRSGPVVLCRVASGRIAPWRFTVFCHRKWKAKMPGRQECRPTKCTAKMHGHPRCKEFSDWSTVRNFTHDSCLGIVTHIRYVCIFVKYL